MTERAETSLANKCAETPTVNSLCEEAAARRSRFQARVEELAALLREARGAGVACARWRRAPARHNADKYFPFTLVDDLYVRGLID